MNVPHTPTQPLLELDLLKTLIAIADTGNFSTAAELVLRTPSAVSMQVKKIEEIVGVPIRWIGVGPNRLDVIDRGEEYEED